MLNKKELNASTVGATSSRPHFEEITLKNQKGITLIALIITIIVMLILVGVTINVALNGGLFTKAEQATQQMEASMVKEQFEIAKAVEIANNGGKKLEDYSIITIDKLDLDQTTKNKYTNTPTNEYPKIINKFTILTSLTSGITNFIKNKNTTITILPHNISVKFLTVSSYSTLNFICKETKHIINETKYAKTLAVITP